MTTEINPAMQSEIAAAIKKNLSPEVGAALQAELTDLVVLRNKAEIDRLTLAKAQVCIDNQKAELEKHGALETRESAVFARENAVSARERDRDVFEAKLRAEQAEKRADLAVTLVSTVFRSPVFTRTFTENNSGQVPVPTGSYTQSVTSSKSGGETVKID